MVEEGTGAEGAVDLEARRARPCRPKRRVAEAEDGVWVRVQEEKESSRAEFGDAGGRGERWVVESHCQGVR